MPTTSLLERSHREALVLSGVTHEKWCCDPTYKLITSNKVRDLLRSNTAVILRVPLFLRDAAPASKPFGSEEQGGADDNNDAQSTAAAGGAKSHTRRDRGRNPEREVAVANREEALRKAKLVLSSILNECILYSNETGLPDLQTWGVKRDPLRPEYAEVIIRPHRKYGSSDYQEVHRALNAPASGGIV
jgi:hypothetical protein